jgi:hypothetical protein
VDGFRKGIIDKYLSSKNKDLLEARVKIILSSAFKPEIVKLTDNDNKMLEMSGINIRNGKLISQ